MSRRVSLFDRGLGLTVAAALRSTPRFGADNLLGLWR